MAAILAETDTVVVGGGPAGLAVALELRRKGRDVLVVDRADPPIDKPCGEGLMPDGVERLRDMGVQLPRDHWTKLRGIRYIDGEIIAEGCFPDQPGCGVRRPILHAAMVTAARSAGAEIRWRLPVRGLSTAGVLTDQGQIVAHWVVGADGLQSRVRRWANLESGRARFRRNGVRRHFAIAPWTDMVEVYWADRCEAYVTPVSPREVGVAILWSGEKSDFDRLLPRFPRLSGRLAAASPASDDRGAGRLERRCRSPFRGRVALVGDAAGYRDAITGEGLSLAFLEAAALATAIEAGDLGPYAAALRRLTAFPYALIRVLLEVECRPGLRRRLMRALAADPALFASVLAVHTRQSPVRSLLPGRLLRLLRGVLSATK